MLRELQDTRKERVVMDWMQMEDGVVTAEWIGEGREAGGLTTRRQCVHDHMELLC